MGKVVTLNMTLSLRLYSTSSVGSNVEFNSVEPISSRNFRLLHTNRTSTLI